MGPTLHALSIHVDYRCAGTSLCCASGWRIPVERSVRQHITRLMAEGRIAVPGGETDPEVLFERCDELPESRSALLGTRGGRCVFLEDSGLCAIHRQAGHSALPSECQHFPRICVLHPLGVSVTLSHLCPTAAEMLFREDRPLAIVVNPPILSERETWEGLDAREALPPMICPDALMRWEDHAHWERHMVATLARGDLTPEQALGLLAAQGEMIRSWRESDGEFSEHLRRCCDEGRPSESGSHGLGIESTEAIFRELLHCIPPSAQIGPPPCLDHFADHLGRSVQPHWLEFQGPIRRYLASKAFANWIAYQGQGMRSALFAVIAAHASLRVHAALRCEEAGRPLDRDLLREAIRDSDLLLVHRMSRELFTALCDRRELDVSDHLTT
ncbi:hypothetical protein JXA47_14380 [Candidatus Sumerlaeota bacterium]|nr:hypothetical protein [Candidatus Sumerlaeota bacterium]